MFYVASLKKVDDKENEFVNPCGSSYGLFVRDLKTLRGLENRMKNWVKQPKEVEKVAVYEFPESAIYRSKDYRLKALYSVVDGKINTSIREYATSIKIKID